MRNTERYCFVIFSYCFCYLNESIQFSWQNPDTKYINVFFSRPRVINNILLMFLDNFIKCIHETSCSLRRSASYDLCKQNIFNPHLQCFSYHKNDELYFVCEQLFYRVYLWVYLMSCPNFAKNKWKFKSESAFCLQYEDFTFKCLRSKTDACGRSFMKLYTSFKSWRYIVIC